MFLVHVSQYFYIFDPCKFMFLILILVSLYIFNFDPYNIFRSILVLISLRFSNFSLCKCELVGTINEKTRILQGPKLRKRKLRGTKNEQISYRNQNWKNSNL